MKYSKSNPAIYKKTIHQNQVRFIRFMQGWFNINQLYHISRLKRRKSMIISIDSEKAFGKIQYIFLIKISGNWNKGNISDVIQNLQETLQATSYLMVKQKTLTN